MDPVEEKLARYCSRLAQKISRLRVKYYTAHVIVGGIWVDLPVPNLVHERHDKMFSYWVELNAKLEAMRKPVHKASVSVSNGFRRKVDKKRKMILGNIFSM